MRMTRSGIGVAFALASLLLVSACQERTVASEGEPSYDDRPTLSDVQTTPPRGYTEMCEREEDHALCK